MVTIIFTVTGYCRMAPEAGFAEGSGASHRAEDQQLQALQVDCMCPAQRFRPHQVWVREVILLERSTL